MSYSIETHRHRFAAWAASRAASVNTCRFPVEHGKQFIELAGIVEIGHDISNLPNPHEFDKKHREWRISLIKHAQSYQPAFTHGVAAKLINIYFKSIFVCSGMHDDPRVKAIHPPIDRVLLNTLYHKDVGGLKSDWQVTRKIGWSKFSSDQYENLIKSIQKVVQKDVGLCSIEEHWQGFQTTNKKSSSKKYLASSQNSPINTDQQNNTPKGMKKMANADILWEFISGNWPEESKWTTIDQIESIAPLETAGITKPSSYAFAMLTLLSTVRRDFIIHEDTEAENAINDEIIKTNRNNGIWRHYPKSRVRKKHLI